MVIKLEEKKYEILIDKENTIEFEGRTLHRIRALRNFNDVKAGDIGGFVESEWNLSQEGNCWIYDDAICMDSASVCDNAKMYNRSCMYNYSRMYDNSEMYDNSRMYNNSKMFDNSSLHGNAKASGNAILKDDDSLCGKINKPFKKIFQYMCEKRFLTAILTEENEILYSIDCQVGITKEELIDRIYNYCEIKGNGLVEYPHKQEYLDMIDIIENYFEKFKN